MIDSRWSAEVINNARHHDAYNPYKEINVDEPRFKGCLGRNHVRFQQGEHHKKENAGEQVCNEFCHTLKIIQIKNISCKKTAKISVVLRNNVTKDPVISRFTLVIPNEVRTTQKASVVAMLAWI